MTTEITNDNYRATVSNFGDCYRVQYHLAGELVGSFRWCDTMTEVGQLLEELGMP